MLLFWSRSGKRTRSIIFSRLTDGTPHSSSDLLYFTLLLPFTWTNYFKSNSLFPFCLFGQKFSKSKFLFSSLFGQEYSKSNFNNKKKSTTSPNLVLAAKTLQFYKNILSPIFFLTEKNFLFLPTNSILLPPESKRCPLTLASALACADSVDGLWFWNKSES